MPWTITINPIILLIQMINISLKNQWYNRGGIFMMHMSLQQLNKTLITFSQISITISHLLT